MVKKTPIENMVLWFYGRKNSDDNMVIGSEIQEVGERKGSGPMGPEPDGIF